MLDPKEYLTVCGPKKGDCYVCGKSLVAIPSLQVNVNVPLTKFKKVAGRACVECALEFRTLVDLRIAQAQRGEYQA
jgi:hypothetical protein